MEQNANMGAHMATHISGRATVAAWKMGSENVYCCRYTYDY